jgi:tetratricopeptide (TPR) repeat protein
MQQRDREVAERQAHLAAQSGDAYLELVADGSRYGSQRDMRKAARAYREAIALRPDEPLAYFNLGAVLGNSGHHVEAAQRFLEAKERYPAGSGDWAEATAMAIDMLTREACDEVAKPEWWSDKGLKALSARVVRAAPDDLEANKVRAGVLIGQCVAWKAGPRSAAELREAATHYERAAALQPAPVVKASSLLKRPGAAAGQRLRVRSEREVHARRYRAKSEAAEVEPK